MKYISVLPSRRYNKMLRFEWYVNGNLFLDMQSGSVSTQQQTGFQWGNLAGMALKLLVGGPKQGASDKADTITKLAVRLHPSPMQSLGR